MTKSWPHKFHWLGVLAGLTFLSACSMSFPGEGYVTPDYGVRVVLQIDPDDAEVRLNGRLIGAAYEFDTARTALRLDPDQDELVLQRKGYQEEVVELDGLPRRATVRLSLRPLSRLRAPFAGKPAPNPRPEPRPDQPAPSTGQTEPLAPLPEAEDEGPLATPEAAVTLEVVPEGSTIYLDGKFFGLAPENGRIDRLVLGAGIHRFEVFHPGYRPAQKEIQVDKARSLVVKIILVKE